MWTDRHAGRFRDARVVHAMARFLCAVAMLACSGVSAAAGVQTTLSVTVGDVTRSLDIVQIQALAGAARNWRVHEPHEKAERVYRGVPVRALLDALYGDAWRQTGAVLFECADGYRALVSPDKLMRNAALLSWASEDVRGFKLINRLQGDEMVELGPFYLVWDNLAHADLFAEGASDWPYQVVGVALVDARTHLAAAWPADDAGTLVHKGFDAFRRHCAVCHPVNGAGGAKARDLNRPQSVTVTTQGDWLRRWMLDPAGILPGTTMPGLPDTLPDREAVAASIEAYLRSMATTP